MNNSTPNLNPLVTVCIPAYNAEKTIRYTIDSILAQDYNNIEIIVCDNLSNDGTAEIIKSYEKNGVKYFLNPTAGSAESNWNYALDLPNGDFIALYHADDVYSPSMVSTQMKFFAHNPDVCSVFTMSTLINRDGQVISPKVKAVSSIPGCDMPDKIFNFSAIFNAVLKHSNFIRTPTLMTRKETFSAVGKFNLKFKSSADLDLWLRMAKYKSIGIINKPLHKYRISPWQGTATILSGIKELPDFFSVTENYLKESGQLVSSKSLAYYQMIKGGELILCAMNLLLIRETTKAKESLKQALSFKNMKYAITRKRVLIRYIIGCLFLSAIYLRIGHLVSKMVNFAYQKDKKMWDRPIKKILESA